MKVATGIGANVLLGVLLLTGVAASAQKDKSKKGSDSADSAQSEGKSSVALDGDSKDAAKMGSVKNNPLYDGTKADVTNPLHKDQRESAPRHAVSEAGNLGDSKTDPSATHSNPAFQESGNQGTMPSEERKESNSPKPSYSIASPRDSATGQASGKMLKPTTSTNSHEVVEYKDGEDGTMHTRPGNHKK